ncbi:hypothetical protein O7626_18285 [Micromonospora sp. WMMD1102]|uniref:hypothetical protein n=1 Tax=Micromonospora sp. WMMD1102 TaxID=3016105 RepID=UPI002414FEF0|nr:hypothetical protein [Micromonospora sp. WMMD1102]MDG4787864.1 hypothetical protein [Micromonospora sp. WMMD1102]
MPLSLSSAALVLEPGSVPYRPDPDCAIFERDLLVRFGIQRDEERLRQGANVGFTELAEAVIEKLPFRLASPDLLVFAFGLPDMIALKHVAQRVGYLLGGGSHCFAVSEQGLRAPFTALRVADAFARSGRCRTLALVVCEQNTFAYPDPFVEENKVPNSAALLYFDDTGRYEFAGTRMAHRDTPLRTLLRSVATDPVTGPDPDSTLLVAGSWASSDDLADTGWPVHRAAAGPYCTGVWLELARHHQEWAEAYRSVVLCDTDPRTGQSQVAVLRRRPAAPTPRRAP